MYVWGLTVCGNCRWKSEGGWGTNSVGYAIPVESPEYIASRGRGLKGGSLVSKPDFLVNNNTLILILSLFTLAMQLSSSHLASVLFIPHSFES